MVLSLSMTMGFHLQYHNGVLTRREITQDKKRQGLSPYTVISLMQFNSGTSRMETVFQSALKPCGNFLEHDNESLSALAVVSFG